MPRNNKRLRVFVKHVINPILRNLTHSSRGHFALLYHVGRRSGKTYESPIMAFNARDGFVIVLTYGPDVDWLRNLQTAGQGKLLWHKQEYALQKPVFIDARTALPVLPPFIRFVLRLNGAKEFVKVASQPISSGE